MESFSDVHARVFVRSHAMCHRFMGFRGAESSHLEFSARGQSDADAPRTVWGCDLKGADDAECGGNIDGDDGHLRQTPIGRKLCFY